MKAAQGRLDHGPPVAVIDIGSNSVRLVVYEGLTRSPTPIFNEKVLAGLGREVQSTGLLAADAVDKALDGAAPLPRAVRPHATSAQVWVIATAACRDAKNGKAFIAEAERICRTKIDVLSGKREAELSALGVVSGLPPARRHRRRSRRRLARTDRRARPPRQARRHAAARRPGAAGRLGEIDQEGREDRREGARAASAAQGRRGPHLLRHRRHLARARAPAHVADRLSAARDARLRHPGAGRPTSSRGLVHRVDPETLSQIEVVADARRPLLAYAALVLEHVVRIARPKEIVISALGVREGLLYSHARRRGARARTR